MTTRMPPFLELDGLSVDLGRPILKSLSGAFSGRAIGLLGPNGAGKTTLIRTLLGFHRPSAGGARILGLDIRSQMREIRPRIGYMPENDAFVADMTAIRFVRLMAELSGLPAEAAMERAHETLFFVGLGDARYRRLGAYSLGMRQMAKLAAAIVHGPQTVILDEPTNALDPAGRQRMIQLIREIRDAGQARVILSSHLLPDVEACCDEVLILKDGRVASQCNLEEERRANRKFIELELHGEFGPFLDAAQRRGCVAATNDRTRRIKMVLPEQIEIRDLYELADRHTVQIRRMEFKRDSLQDIFMNAMETRPEPHHGRL
ncbi:MAG TPA: ABC transporter ATP-binding protein [Terriglobia bacterium]|nr:ABC transporter ATP-binding protein [Terriglobia bacterium]